MQTRCNSARMAFQGHGRREVVADFDGGQLSSDGGALLLREADGVFGVSRRLAECFTDYRDPGRSGHDPARLAAPRLMAIALGCEDISDLERLRDDSVLALAVGRDDVTGGGSATRAIRWPAPAH